MNTSKPIEDRFWSRVQRSDDERACWLWLGPTANGYGRIGVGPRGTGMLYAHRLSVELAGRQIPDGREVDHLCRNRLCVNPVHLEVVTKQENIRREAAALAATRQACRRGHPMSAHTVRETRTPKGHLKRECLVCKKSSDRARYERVRDAARGVS